MLLNPRYRGDWYWNVGGWEKTPEALMTEEQKERAREKGCLPKKRLLKPEGSGVGGYREELRIIPQDLWEAVQARFEARKGKGKKTGRNPAHLLSGLIQCPCGGNIVVVRSSRKKRRDAELGCSRRRNRGSTACGNDGSVAEPELAGKVLHLVRDELLQPEGIEYAVEEINRRILKSAKAGIPRKRLANLRRELRGIETEINRYVVAIGKGIDLDEVKQALDGLRERRERIQADIHRLSRPRRPHQIPKVKRQDLARRLDRLWDDLNGGDVSKARWLLRKLLGQGQLDLPSDKKDQSWRITFRARPLDILMPEMQRAYKSGTGGGIRTHTGPGA
jgi:hypothetical protein